MEEKTNMNCDKCNNKSNYKYSFKNFKNVYACTQNTTPIGIGQYTRIAILKYNKYNNTDNICIDFIKNFRNY